MKIGLLGAGRAGLMHARILAHRVDELVIAEPKPERSAAVVSELEGEAATRARISEASVEATLTDVTLDALVLTSPTDVHAEQLLRGMELGIPMFTEKPVSTSLASTLKVREAPARAEPASKSASSAASIPPTPGPARRCAKKAWASCAA